MWLLYLEVAILVVLAFAVGAGIAALVMRRVVPLDPPGDELGTVRPEPGAGS